MGLREDRLDLPIGALSGGERRRAELVRILFGGSELLLLDEPTNHLDADAHTWILKFLRDYRGALVVVSHDLDLLDEAITRVVHLDREAEEATGSVVEYKGTYSQYLVQRAADEERLGKLATRQDREIARLSQLASSMRGQTAKRAKVAQEPRRARRPHRGEQGAGANETALPAPALPGAAVVRAHRAHRHRDLEVVRRGSTCSPTSASTSAAASASS